MTLGFGTRLGPYEVLSALGAGGMGEVYRARDTKLGRDVAIKVLPDSLAGDPDRLARFEREAKVLAALNHPNIAHIHGFEDSTGVPALVMELVEGPTLADRIAHGPIPIDETLPIARQIADALEAAHEQGIIHRDLKPANIKVRSDGTVKVLDFGLAKAMEPRAGSSPSVSMSPTLTTPAMTQAGMILGTAAYMSPEQAKGRVADKRSDVWAFGCVLFEMLSGHRAFEGEDVSDTLAFILTKEPDWTALPKQASAPIRRLLRRCLQKDRKQRLADIADARLEVDEVTTPAGGNDLVPIAALNSRRRLVVAIGTALVGSASIAALLMWALARPAPITSPQPMRFTIVPSASQRLAISPGSRDIAIAPNGAHLVYISDDGQLMVRAVGQLDATPLRGVTNARFPFISVDSQWIGFFGPSGLRKVAMSGGPVMTLSRTSRNSLGASWGPDDTIVFGTNDRGLMSVSASGGEPKNLTTPNAAKGEGGHVLPSYLPGGHAVLFTILPAIRSPGAEQVAVLDLNTGRYKVVIRGASSGEYVSSGHVTYLAGGSLRAQRFDLTRLEVSGDPVIVLDSVQAGSDSGQYSISRNGTLLYVPGSAAGGALMASRSMVWVDRQGREEPIAAPRRAYGVVRLSPDETRVAVDIRDNPTSNVWTWDLTRQTLTRLTLEGSSSNPVWTPDGRRLVFRSDRDGSSNLFWQAADGTGVVERLTSSPNPQLPKSVSPDGSILFTENQLKGGGLDIRRLRFGPQRHSESLIQSNSVANNPDVSPDGRWLAYQSDESGTPEIYVRPFPSVDAGRWQISSGGGSVPLWDRKGRELFYFDANRTLMSVTVQTGAAFQPGKPTKVFDRQYVTGGGARTYDVSRNGRFLMLKQEAANDQTQAPASMIVVLNWLEELKQRVPTK